MSGDERKAALEQIRAGGFRVGAELDAAHEICQRHEGTPAFDHIHALIHRIEGDDGNAAYWYRRAGAVREAGPVEEEWEVLRAAAG